MNVLKFMIRIKEIAGNVDLATKENDRNISLFSANLFKMAKKFSIKKNDFKMIKNHVFNLKKFKLIFN